MRKHVAAMSALLLLQSAQAGAADGPAPADAFMSSLARLCGQAFAGRITANEPRTDSDPFEGKALVMHVRECRQDEIRVPFHVGEDRSRTWVITRTTSGLRLKHDHRHEDGTSDPVTMYGGDTIGEGSARSQSFPVDAESIALFGAAGLTASITNVWTVEVDPAHVPGASFAYQLARTKAAGAPADRFFRVEFDAAAPVTPPPPPWGH